MSLGSSASDSFDSKRQRALTIARANAHMKTFNSRFIDRFRRHRVGDYGAATWTRLPDMMCCSTSGMPEVEGAIAKLCTVGTTFGLHSRRRIENTTRTADQWSVRRAEVQRAWHAGVAILWAGTFERFESKLSRMRTNLATIR